MIIQRLTNYIYYLDNCLTQVISSKFPFASSHLTTSTSAYFTKLLFIIFALILVYETVFFLGHKLKFWQDHSKKIFVYKPVHCAHVYVRVHRLGADIAEKISSINMEDDAKIVSVMENSASKKNSVKYHFEFGPDDYDYEKDKELGCTINFLINKLNTVLENTGSGTYYLIKNREIKNKEQFLDDALCLQGIETGNTVDYFVLN